MLKKIEALRLQPKHVRNRYAFWVALGSTFVIACVWMITSLVPSKIAEPAVTQDAQVESSLSRAWQDLKATVGASFAQFRTQTMYVQEDTALPSVQDTNIIDLDALLASSSPHRSAPTSTKINPKLPAGATNTQPISTSTQP